MEDRSILEGKTLEDLRYIAKMLGLKSITKYRKSELIDLIISVGDVSQTKSETKEQGPSDAKAKTEGKQKEAPKDESKSKEEKEENKEPAEKKKRGRPKAAPAEEKTESKQEPDKEIAEPEIKADEVEPQTKKRGRPKKPRHKLKKLRLFRHQMMKRFSGKNLSLRKINSLIITFHLKKPIQKPHISLLDQSKKAFRPQTTSRVPKVPVLSTILIAGILSILPLTYRMTEKTVKYYVKLKRKNPNVMARMTVKL